MRAREDPRSGLAPQVLEREPRVVALPERRGTRLDERPHERPVLVQRRPAERLVLLERERQVLVDEEAECAEGESAQGAIEVRSAHGHSVRYCAAGPSPLWHDGHQYVMRAPSPSGQELIGVPQHGHGLCLRR